MSHTFRLLGLAAALVALVALAGCPQPSQPTTPATSGPAASDQPLKLLVVDDASLGEAIAREWRSRTEGTIEVAQVSLADVLNANRLAGDAIVFPSGYVGELAEREMIVPLADEALAGAKFDRRDIFDQVRLRDIQWGNRTLAVPLGSPQLLLVYRRDLFSERSLDPPRTWQEYQQVIERLTAGSQDGEPKTVPAAEPLADGWAGKMLLARAAAYVTHRDQVSPLFHYTTLEPLITRPPYVRALEELVAAHQAASAVADLTPEAALAELCAGRALMALTWPSPQPRDAKVCDGPLGFALLPGSSEAYNFPRAKWEPRAAGEETHVPLLGMSGRVAAVTSTTPDADRAQRFLAWLASREMSPLVGPASSGTTLHRQSHLTDPSRWTAGLDAAAAASYAQTLQQSAALQRFVSLPLPGRNEYLAALDDAVQAAVAGDKSPADALAAASAKWQEITAARGLDKQRRALQRSLGN
jgi:multiple sugar transport system substrate-binding protein